MPYGMNSGLKSEVEHQLLRHGISDLGRETEQ